MTGLVLIEAGEEEVIVVGTSEGWIVFLSFEGEVTRSYPLGAGVTVLTRLALPEASGLLVGTGGGQVTAVLSE